MNDESEKDLEGSDLGVIEYYHSICLEWLRKSREISFRITGVPEDICTYPLSKTILELYRYASPLGNFG
jgi:hypothetical protein